MATTEAKCRDLLLLHRRVEQKGKTKAPFMFQGPHREELMLRIRTRV